MGTEVRLDHDKGFVVVTVTGEISLPQFEAALEMLAGDDSTPSDIPALWDLREADFQNVTAETWRGIIGVLKRHPERSRALVAQVVSSEFAFGMMRMFQILLGLESVHAERDTQAFRTYADAEAWLVERASA
jgi:hypothetical protein